MKNNLCFMSFFAGMTVGALMMWRFVKNKYEQIAQEEIDSVKKVFEKKKEVEGEEIQDISDYKSKVDKMGYTENSENEEQRIEEGENILMEKPYTISPEEFGQFDDYEAISLIYYADNILTDDNNDLVDNVDDIVGFDSLNHFGEYEEDSVFVRNDRLKCDYEILLDKREYADV